MDRAKAVTLFLLRVVSGLFFLQHGGKSSSAGSAVYRRTARPRRSGPRRGSGDFWSSSGAPHPGRPFHAARGLHRRGRDGGRVLSVPPAGRTVPGSEPRRGRRALCFIFLLFAAWGAGSGASTRRSPGGRGPRLPALSLALRSEELLQQIGGLLAEESAFHFAAVVEPGVARDVTQRAAVAGLGIGAAEDDPGDPGVDRRAGAHRAGLDGGVERGPSSRQVRRLRAASRMASISAWWVGSASRSRRLRPRPIIRPVPDHDGADRNLLFRIGDARKRERLAHEARIVRGKGHRPGGYRTTGIKWCAQRESNPQPPDP